MSASQCPDGRMIGHFGESAWFDLMTARQSSGPFTSGTNPGKETSRFTRTHLPLAAASTFFSILIDPSGPRSSSTGFDLSGDNLGTPVLKFPHLLDQLVHRVQRDEDTPF